MLNMHARPIVFVVDDDISVRESLELLIRTAGWYPQVFASAEEFLAWPRLSWPSCLVLDVSLPNLTGLDLQKLLDPGRRPEGAGQDRGKQDRCGCPHSAF